MCSYGTVKGTHIFRSLFSHNIFSGTTSPLINIYTDIEAATIRDADYHINGCTYFKFTRWHNAPSLGFSRPESIMNN